MIAADRMEVHDGTLCFWQDRADGPLLLLAVADKEWGAAYAQSTSDSSPAAVWSWKKRDGRYFVSRT